jgi:periplasmic protein TonB
MVIAHIAASGQPETPDSTDAVQSEKQDTIKYVQVDEHASFPGGFENLSKWLSKNLSYPESAKDSLLEGVVYVQFVVEEDGRLTSIEARQGVHPLLDSAAIAAIAKMPPWIPGKFEGKAVRSIFILPIQFQLARDNAPGPRKQRGKRR